MIKHGKIVVPTDFSEPSDEALRRGLLLAKAFDAEVHLLHVLEPVIYFETDLLSLYPVDEMIEVMRAGVKRRLKKQVAKVGGEVITHLLEAVGDPGRAICRFSEEMPADLIVIGRHGRQGVIEHMLIGSTAERVVRHAPCSVFVAMPHGLLTPE